MTNMHNADLELKMNITYSLILKWRCVNTTVFGVEVELVDPAIVFRTIVARNAIR